MMNNPENKKVTKFSDPILQMCIWVFVLNLGISIIFLETGGFEGFKAAFPAWIGLFMVCVMGASVGMSLLGFHTMVIKRILRFVLSLLGIHELYYLILWKSPSIQLLSVLLLSLGMLLGRQSDGVSQ